MKTIILRDWISRGSNSLAPLKGGDERWLLPIPKKSEFKTIHRSFFAREKVLIEEHKDGHILQAVGYLTSLSIPKVDMNTFEITAVISSEWLPKTLIKV